MLTKALSLTSASISNLSFVRLSTCTIGDSGCRNVAELRLPGRAFSDVATSQAAGV